MEYQKIMNLLDNQSSQPSKFRIKNWVEINNESNGNYSKENLKFDATILTSSLCDYSDTYIVVIETITVVGQGNDEAAIATDKTHQNCPPFTSWIRKINNFDVDNAEDRDVVIAMYNILEYSNNYAKMSASLWQYCRDLPDNDIANSESFKVKSLLTNNISNDGTVNVAILVLLKYLSNFWRTLEMPLANCEIALELIWPANSVICKENRVIIVAMTYTKLDVPVVTFSTQNNEKLLQQLK